MSLAIQHVNKTRDQTEGVFYYANFPLNSIFFLQDKTPLPPPPIDPSLISGTSPAMPPIPSGTLGQATSTSGKYLRTRCQSFHTLLLEYEVQVCMKLNNLQLAISQLKTAKIYRLSRGTRQKADLKYSWLVSNSCLQYSFHVS